MRGILMIGVMALLFITACESAPAPTPTTAPSPTPTSVTIAKETTIPTRIPYPLPYPLPQIISTTMPPTSTPSPSATVTPTAIPTTVPPVEVVSADTLPSLPHDLLFISNHKLIRWNVSTKRVEQLATVVKQFATSSNGKRVALSLQDSASEDQIALLDLSSRQFSVLTQVPAIAPRQFWQAATLAISPDGQWVAYVRNRTWAQNAITPTPTELPAQAHEQFVEGDLFITHTETPERTIHMGHCDRVQVYEPQQTACFNMVWSPDSKLLAWADTRGVWISQINQPPRLLRPSVRIPSEGPAKRIEFWHPRSFSRSGRYLLALIGLYEGGEWGIMDSQTGKSVVIPETLIYGSPYAYVSWLRDERLFVVSGVRMWEPSPPTGYIWSIESSSTLTVTSQLMVRISNNANNTAIAPAQFENGQLAFGLSNDSPTEYLERGLYTLNLSAPKPRKLTGMPPRPLSQLVADPQVFWSPDGKGAIILNLSATDQVRDAQGGWRVFSHTIFAPTDGSRLYDLNPVIGDNACCFVWLK